MALGMLACCLSDDACIDQSVAGMNAPNLLEFVCNVLCSCLTPCQMLSAGAFIRWRQLSTALSLTTSCMAATAAQEANYAPLYLWLCRGHMPANPSCQPASMLYQANHIASGVHHHCHIVMTWSPSAWQMLVRPSSSHMCLKYRPFSFDVESTGLSTRTERIIELAIVDVRTYLRLQDTARASGTDGAAQVASPGHLTITY